MAGNCSNTHDLTISVADLGADDRVISVTIAAGVRFGDAHREEVTARIRAEHEIGADLVYVLFGVDVPRHLRSFVSELGLRVYSKQAPDGIDEVIASGNPADIRRALFPRTPDIPIQPDTPKVPRPGLGNVTPKPEVEAYFRKRKAERAARGKVSLEDIEMQKKPSGGYRVYYRGVYVYSARGRSIDLPLDDWEIEEARLNVEAKLAEMTPEELAKFDM